MKHEADDRTEIQPKTTLVLIGIGSGNLHHLTQQAIAAMNAADVILIPRKGPNKEDLADLRREICSRHLTVPGPRLHEFDVPLRDASTADYTSGVDEWHAAIAATWGSALAETLPQGGTAALLVWGDPSLYDSSLRIAERLQSPLKPSIRVIPGITSIQALCAGHGISVNEIGEAFLVTTGRRLRADGWPPGIDTLVVMLDGTCAFQSIKPEGITIWWSAYAGMDSEIRISGPLAKVADQILSARQAARETHGWIMDIYLMRRSKNRG